MFGLHDLWVFVIAGFALNLTPGPDTAYIVGRSLQLGASKGVVAALGIGAGCLVHITAAALGVSALIAASATAYLVMKVVGAAYLGYLGIRMLIGGKGGVRATTPPPAASVFWQGFLTNALNPKVALFFLAFLPQFISADAPSKPLAFVLLGLIFNLNGTLWNVAVAAFSARLARTAHATPRLRLWSERALGTVFVGLGVRLALSHRI